MLKMAAENSKGKATYWIDSINTVGSVMLVVTYDGHLRECSNVLPLGYRRFGLTEARYCVQL